MSKPKAKKSSDSVMVSVRLTAAVRNAIDVLARQESIESGYTVSQANIISPAVMERYRKRKRKT